jgi:Xaa-Pro aminopeptidase
VVESLRNENGVFLGFDDLTLCPYDRSLIDVNLLDATEREQVDAYHRRVYETLAPRLPEKTAKWLKSATRPLPRPKKAKAAQPAS